MKNFSVFNTFENFWPIGYLPRILLGTEDNRFLIGVADSNKNNVLTVLYKDEVSMQVTVKRYEISTRERVVGAELCHDESSLVVCSLADAKISTNKAVNALLNPLTLNMALYEYRYRTLDVVVLKEFQRPKIDKTHLMRKAKAGDLYMVAMDNSVALFSLEKKRKFIMLKTYENVFECPIFELYFLQETLVIVPSPKGKEEAIKTIDFATKTAPARRADLKSLQKMIGEARELQDYKAVYLQPNCKSSTLKRYRNENELTKEMLTCQMNSEVLFVAYSTGRGVGLLNRADSELLSEIASLDSCNFHFNSDQT